MIRIVVDSSADYSNEEIKDLGLKMVPLNITMGDKSYADGKELDKNTFYEMLLNGEDFPKTSQPSPNAFLDVFNEAKENGDEVICILLSSALSGTYQSAKLAKDMAEYDNIYLIDSLSAVAGIRILVNHALKMVKENKTAIEIVETIESLKSRIVILAGVDTLEYLCKGGRVSKTVAAIGGFANIKPIITVSKEGKVEVISKKRGTSKVLDYLNTKIHESNIDYDYDVFAVYTYGKENLKSLKELLSDIKITDDIQVGPTIGAHLGSEVMGLIFIEK